MVLARGGRTLLGSRRIVVAVAYVCMMAMLGLAHAPSVNFAVGVLCLYVFGLGAWLANQQAFKQDVTRDRIATVAGIVGFAETMLSAVLVENVGRITQRTGAFGAVFEVLAVLFTVGLVSAMIFMRARWLPEVAKADP